MEFFLRGSYSFADHETLGHAPPEAVNQDNLVFCFLFFKINPLRHL